jgi:hypothetical protein
MGETGVGLRCGGVLYRSESQCVYEERLGV